ncbi:hypothetical protein JQ628_12630 [Bradyrhizobium lablabi]|uniref:hypothetical protein n=1 Tax=Bradyrhizobium lablabi TaxID=722472 RepID=UPI001BA7BA5E|nr:hypothetical protein [Bradyrhizobium lablabi]MBR1122363.1 hypothetical protein [Bradyrhizobium lablabi]
MLRRVLIAISVALPAALPTASQAQSIQAKTPDSAFAGKLRPDILGVSEEATADSARAIFDAAFKGRTDTRTDIQQQKFGATSYISALNFSAPAGAKTGEALSANFSSPASANRAYFVVRNLTFAKDQQPSIAEMVKQVMDKYGVPTIVGDQHLYYVYRGKSIVSVGGKYKEPAAVEAIARPLDPKMALKLNATSTGRGSCVAVVKRALAKDRTLNSLLDDAKGANCDGVLSAHFTPGTASDRVGTAEFTLLDVKRVISAAAIDSEALAATQGSSALPKGAAPKL